MCEIHDSRAVHLREPVHILWKVILSYNGYCSQTPKKFMQNVGRRTGILSRKKFLPYLDGTLTLPFEKQAKQLVWSTYTYTYTYTYMKT